MNRVREREAAALLVLVFAAAAGGCFASRRTLLKVGKEVDGVTVTLDERIFSDGIRILGLWKADRYYKSLGVPVFQVVEHDPDRLPVLLVHGYNDNAKSMRYLGGLLDPEKFEPLYANYPTGLALDKVAVGLVASVSKLAAEKKLDRMGVVAFSMGGLVARKFLGTWSRAGKETKMPIYISMAAPYGGIEVGSKLKSWRLYEPESWNDIGLGSDFLDHLFDDPLPPETAFHLIYAVSEGKPAVPGVDDGIVSVASATRPQAVDEADTVSEIRACYHGTLLKKKEPIMKVIEFLLAYDKAWRKSATAPPPATP
jgi:pimeloyl-ACP methyl ester carboxylesterase